VEAFDQLRSLAQRTMSAAHQVDDQLELPETAEMVGAMRALLAALAKVGARLRPVVAVVREKPATCLDPPPPAPIERPIGLDDEVLIDGKEPGRVRFLFNSAVEGPGFVVETRRGLVRAAATRCTPKEGK
jgi:hypothetical protein